MSSNNLLRIKTVQYQDEIVVIKHIRTKVFQEEQEVDPELEFDGLDADAIHFLAYINNQAVGTARVREINSNTSKIERLAVLAQARKQGIGKKLMSAALKTIAQQNKTTVIIHSQEYIAPLYQQLGFKIVGEKFSEAGIAHVKMVKQLSQSD
ncbi:MAG: GNAT family N-acetyltransferase [Pleurocapsa sp.]